MPEPSFYFAGLLTLLFSAGAAFYYYRRYFKKEIAVSIVVYSALIFTMVRFVSFDQNIGLGIGLLGLLSLVRLRSTPENLIDISFIFYSIALGLLNASAENFFTVLLIDAVLTLILLGAVSNLFFKRDCVKTQIIFDSLFITKLNDTVFLKKEIKDKYHINALYIKVAEINYLKDSIVLDVYYETESR